MAALGKTQIFETPDVAEADDGKSGGKGGKKVSARGPGGAQEQKQISEDVVVSDLRPRLAFERFAGRIFSTGAADFSDRVAKDALHHVTSSEQELRALPADERRFESPLERFLRLKREMEEFQTELKELAATKAGKDKNAAAVGQLIARDVDSLQKELQSISKNQAMLPYLSENFATKTQLTQHEAMQKLVADIAAARAEKKAAPGAGGAGGGVTYELYYNKQLDGARSQSDLAEVDRRVARLEQTLGNVPAAQKGAGYPDVHTALRHLLRKMELLDQNKLDGVYRRIKSLMSELEALAEARKKVQDKPASEHMDKVNRVFEMMSKWDQAATLLPAVVARLQSLKELHEESANAVLRIQEVDRRQDQTEKLLSHDKSALERVQQSLQENMAIMERNAKSLEARFAKIEAKMGK